LEGGGKRISSLRPAWAKIVRLYLENKTMKGLGDSSSSRHLPLGSIPSTEKKKDFQKFF
jgi:hypothetical protein